MAQLADKLIEAFEKKKNDINAFTWKGPKKLVKGKYVQEEVALMDATPEQLQSFYDHCNSMLYAQNAKVPGRYVLLKQIDTQRNKCAAELLKRWVATNFIADQKDPDNHRANILCFQSQLRDILKGEEASKVAPIGSWETTEIGKVAGVPAEFATIPIQTVLDAFTESLGVFNKSHITLSFIMSLGVWPTKQETEEFLTDELGTPKLEKIKQNLGIANKIAENLKLNTTGLSYTEFRAMYQLKVRDSINTYQTMSTKQLDTLRDKVLYRLEDTVIKHINMWNNKLDEINKVCEKRNITLKKNAD